ncbi:hypothetical protein K435DRAFT_790039 [Dendrothele bispora CBS 962.96]|uniref:Uncharacterized protein n=1 Tax=Dendrothele bispora (strain CBS 962.96) TaxID=1314807 RepID=A0A4S8MRP4_DENBC|nr:hypothetical protein K435DRAFT_790039 [Dendrothele bispora CBS 962.96]
MLMEMNHQVEMVEEEANQETSPQKAKGLVAVVVIVDLVNHQKEEEEKQLRQPRRATQLLSATSPVQDTGHNRQWEPKCPCNLDLARAPTIINTPRRPNSLNKEEEEGDHQVIQMIMMMTMIGEAEDTRTEDQPEEEVVEVDHQVESWGSPGEVLGSPGEVLGKSWAVLGKSWGSPGQSWAVLGHSWTLLGTPGTLLGHSWDNFRTGFQRT